MVVTAVLLRRGGSLFIPDGGTTMFIPHTYLTLILEEQASSCYRGVVHTPDPTQPSTLSSSGKKRWRLLLLYTTHPHAPYSFLPQQRRLRFVVVLLVFSSPASCRPVSRIFPYPAVPPPPCAVTLQDAVDLSGDDHPVRDWGGIIVVSADGT